MYSFIKSLGLRNVMQAEMPALGVSLVIAEMAYKFGSFVLECGAFLATWYLMGMVMHKTGLGKKR
jgi:hypothetical protein